MNKRIRKKHKDKERRALYEMAKVLMFAVRAPSRKWWKVDVNER